MADEGMMNALPTQGSSSGTDASGPGPIKFLTASWVNQRVINVAKQIDKYLERIESGGLVAEGYTPFESPITDEMMTRMTPEQFRMLFDSTPTLEGKSNLLARMKALKLPPHILIPEHQHAQQTPGLAFQTNFQLGSSE